MSIIYWVKTENVDNMVPYLLKEKKQDICMSLLGILKELEKTNKPQNI